MFPSAVSWGVLRHSRRDALLVALAIAHGALLVFRGTAPAIAIGVWWNSNTVAHYFIHRPFFPWRWLNRLFAIYQSVLLGIPQSIWRGRHLAHHAGKVWKPRLDTQLIVECALILALWALLLACWPRFFLLAYIPGYAVGLALCGVQGYFEHARGTISHHGALYNLLFFNDGYHVEHHEHPALHWSELPRQPRRDVPVSRWPAVLRWLDWLLPIGPASVPQQGLDGLERLVLRSRVLQRIMVASHERAIRRILPPLPANPRVAIVGGGLFPRTLLVLRHLLPDARFTIIDRSGASIQAARPFAAARDCFRLAEYDASRLEECDVAVFPLAFRGDRQTIYERPPAPIVLVHDWIWRRRGTSAIVAWWLLKRINRIER